MVAEMSEMSVRAGNLSEITNCRWTVDSQIVGFEKDTLFLEPCEEMGILTAKFDVSQAAVAQHVAADTNLGLVLAFDTRRVLDWVKDYRVGESNPTAPS